MILLSKLLQKRQHSYQEDLIESLKDPEEAIMYLKQAEAYKDRELFLLALRNVAEAHGLIVKASACPSVR